MAAVLADLHTKGLLDQTLVVLGTEFGRTPRINDHDGREHDNEVITCLLAGAGINGEEDRETDWRIGGVILNGRHRPRGC